ncbi:MAG: hypothetical protein IPI38_01010 [Gemmatimonadetes bacterium]|nr:hypothetical protein [Gemmatimonadota bacterium]MBP6668087.1 hypothetical protein [Gemmatimonadales bacterium]MBK6779254.1 hypothetical protein [Gemmatimonadota bacterium]MBK7348433.1 hypothetical protein [Gemmatimonadota bacterium]MBK7714003.1 hypothetical protein [Gemmatimonadota bacterium]
MSATPRLSTLLLLATALPACSGLGERLGRTGRGDAALDSARLADSVAQAAAAPAATDVLPVTVDSALPWPELERRLRATPESVRAVMQRHDRSVAVLFLDGRRYHGTEPTIDAIIALLRTVDPSGRILIATE